MGRLNQRGVVRIKQTNVIFPSVAVGAFVLGCYLGVILRKSLMIPATPQLSALRPVPPSSVHNIVADGARDGDGRSATFLLGIFSTSMDNDWGRRALIRRTFLNVTDPSFCSLAQYVRGATDSSELRCRVAYAFVLGRSDLEDESGRGENFADDIDSLVTAPLASPSEDEPDVIRLDIKENMNEGKTPTWFRLGALLSDAYGIDYVGKADSDILMSVPRLIRLVEKYLPPQRGMSGPGGSRRRRPIYGGGFLEMKEGMCGFDDCNGRIYMGGPFYFASVEVVRHVLSQNRTTRNEDLDFGRRVGTYPGPVFFMELNTDMFWKHPFKTRKRFERAWEGGKKNDQLYANWSSWPFAGPMNIRNKK